MPSGTWPAGSAGLRRQLLPPRPSRCPRTSTWPNPSAAWPRRRGRACLAAAVAAGVLTARARRPDRPDPDRGMAAERGGQGPRPPLRRRAKERRRAEAALRSFARRYDSEGVVMRSGRADALDVGGVEVSAGVGQPPLAARCGPLWPSIARAPRSQSPYSSGAPRRPARRRSSAAANSPASSRSSPRRVAQVTMALVMMADAGAPRRPTRSRRPLRPSKGRPRTSSRASVRRARAASPPTVSASRARRRNVAQSESMPSRR